MDESCFDVESMFFINSNDVKDENWTEEEIACLIDNEDW